MKSRFRLLFVVSAVLSLAGCDKPTPPAAAASVAEEADNQLAEARDALQRQALEIETKTALMDKQLVEMEQSLKDRDNAELRGSLDALKLRNEELRVQADAARRQSDAITQRIAVTPPQNMVPQPMALPDYSLFYERLAPYGRWFEVNGYGYCWQPTRTVAGWRPYLDGCWVWSSFGWAWQSNEPFGWATYHYGRWVNLSSYGWVWVPGSDWAPAWVAWRQSRDCVGWAPLPPEPGAFSGVYRDCDSRYGLGPASYTFINTTQFVRPTYINVYAPVTQQNTIFQHSVNVTQIVPRHGNGHAFVQQGGPPRAQIEQACGQTVPQRQVHSMHAEQLPAQQQHHGRRDADAPMALVELPAVAPGAHVRRPDVKEHIQHPARVGGFDGVPQHVAREIRETFAREQETAAVQRPSAHGHMPNQSARHPDEAPTFVNGAPRVPNARPQETVSSAIATANAAPAQVVAPVEMTAVHQQPGHGNLPHPFPHPSGETPAVANLPSVPNARAQETARPAVATEPVSGATREPRHHAQSAVGVPHARNMPPEGRVAEPAAAAGVTVSGSERTAPAVPSVAQQPAAAERMPPEQVTATASAEAERIHMHAAREQAHAAEMEQRQQLERQQHAMAEKRAAEQTAANAEAEKNRMLAQAAAQQQRMATEQAAAAESEKARQQAASAAAQQQQEMAAQQQRATAERMATEQAAAAEAERVRQQTEAVAMQRQQEEVTRRATEAQARRAAEEQQMRVQQESERHTQEMAQRQAEEASRRQQEVEMQRVQEQAQRQAEEQARRAAEQQMRAQQEAAQRAQEMAQRQAEEAARRAQEQAQRQAEEQARRAQEEAQRAAAEAARNQPAPGS